MFECPALYPLKPHYSLSSSVGGLFFFEYWLPGVYHKAGKPIFSFYSCSSYLIIGESLVDMAEPPVSDFVFV